MLGRKHKQEQLDGGCRTCGGKSARTAICNCNLEHFGQGHRVRLSQWLPSMANINVYERHIWHFCTSSHRFQDSKVKVSKVTLYIAPVKLSLEGDDVFSCACYYKYYVELANIRIYKSRITCFWASSHHFQDINIWNIWHWKMWQFRWQISKSAKKLCHASLHWISIF